MKITIESLKGIDTEEQLLAKSDLFHHVEMFINSNIGFNLTNEGKIELGKIMDLKVTISSDSFEALAIELYEWNKITGTFLSKEEWVTKAMEMIKSVNDHKPAGSIEVPFQQVNGRKCINI